MKKVIAVLLMIFTVAVLFAEIKDDTVRVIADIQGSSSAHFASNEEGADVSGDGVSFSSDDISTDPEATATVYVYGTTNKAEAFVVEIFGTALTRIDENKKIVIPAETIGITVTWSDPDVSKSTQNDKSKTFTTAATDTSSSNGVAGSPGDGLAVTVCADGKYQRSDAKQLTIVADTAAAAKATAGTYWAYLTMVYSAQ